MKLEILNYKLFAFIILCASSFLVNIEVKEHHIVGQQLLKNSSFSQGERNWIISSKNNSTVTISPNLVSIQSTDKNNSTHISQALPIKGLNKKIIFQASIKTKNVKSGEKTWEKGRILLKQHFGDKVKWEANHTLVQLEGENDWKKVAATFKIYDWATKVTVWIGLSNATGTISCKDISIYNVIPSQSYKAIKYSIITCWLFFFIYIFSLYLRKNLFTLYNILILLFITIILIGISIPGIIKNDIKSHLTEQTKIFKKHLNPSNNLSSTSTTSKAIGINSSTSRLSPENESQSLINYLRKLDMTKVAHFVLFLAISFLLCHNNHVNKTTVFRDTLFLACGTELIQLFIEGRSPLVRDVLIDSSGIITGLILATCLHSIKQWFNPKQDSRQKSLIGFHL